MRVGAVHAHTSNALAAATRRRRAPAASWTHTGTHYLSSDGASGSYADAATSAAARVVFGGTGAPTFTVAMWATPTVYSSGLTLLEVSDDGAPSAKISALDDFGVAAEVKNAAGSAATLFGGTEAAQLHIALVSNGTNVYLYENGVMVYFETALEATPYATVDAITLFADYAHGQRCAGDIRDFAIWGRALSAAEVAALHTAGVGHDLRENVGAYTGGGPEHWYPADGDSGTTVTDRGSVGTCPLTLHGGVTIEEA